MFCTRIVVDTSMQVQCSVKFRQAGPCQHHPGTLTPTVPGTRHASTDWRQEEAEHRRPGRLRGRPPHRLQRRGQLTAGAGGRHRLPFQHGQGHPSQLLPSDCVQAENNFFLCSHQGIRVHPRPAPPATPTWWPSRPGTTSSTWSTTWTTPTCSTRSLRRHLSS